MERGIYDRIRRAQRELGRRRISGRHRYTDAGILEVYLWAVVHDRPVSWACDANHWPRGARRGPLPDASTVSRRMRSPPDRCAARARAKRLEGKTGSGLVAVVDGKALPIGPHSHDRQSGYGRSASGQARGYKLHAMIDAQGGIIAWSVAPMHIDERTMARRMLREIDRLCYLLADAGYDANRRLRRGAGASSDFSASRARRPAGSDTSRPGSGRGEESTAGSAPNSSSTPQEIRSETPR